MCVSVSVYAGLESQIDPIRRYNVKEASGNPDLLPVCPYLQGHMAARPAEPQRSQPSAEDKGKDGKEKAPPRALVSPSSVCLSAAASGLPGRTEALPGHK